MAVVVALVDGGGSAGGSGWCWYVGSGMVAVVMEVAIATVMVVAVLAKASGGGGDGPKQCGLYVDSGCFGICDRHNLHLHQCIRQGSPLLVSDP